MCTNISGTSCPGNVGKMAVVTALSQLHGGPAPTCLAPLCCDVLTGMSENTSVCQETEHTRLIVSGQGGTGKSRVISILEQLSFQTTQMQWSISSVVVAPTGLAAFNIGGTTIHRLLCLPVEHGKPTDYTRLSQDQLTIIRVARWLSGRA